MLNNIRNFAKTKFAGVLVVLLIIPFVFWGMGGMFQGGNTNNIAKINDKNISTKNFMIFLNSSKMNSEEIKNNIDNNVLEEALSKLISATLLDMEVSGLNLVISDKILKKGIIENKDFKDENNKFSRTKYEKFLLKSNLTAPEFELRLKENELRRELFNYISGGIKPPIFSVKNNYKEKTKKMYLDFINLSKIYKKKENFSEEEISKFIEENNDILKEKVINFKYSKITPKNLIGLDEYNNLFFEKIDEIENEILNGSKINSISQKYNLKLNIENNYKINEKSVNSFYKKIYDTASIGKIELLDQSDYYILYEITEMEEIIPSINNENFISKVKEKLYNKSKFGFNNELIKKISNKNFTQNDFVELASKNSTAINNIEIESINDHKKFSKDSVIYLYSLTKNNFGLVGDKEKNIYLIKIVNIEYKNINKSSQNFKLYEAQEKQEITDYIYGSYDFFLNDKYKVKINEKTLERVKNYFR